MSKLLTEEEANFFEQLIRVGTRSDCKITVEDSPKGYKSYHFVFDFGVDKFESFVIVWLEGNSGGAEENNYEELTNEIEQIVEKAEAVKG